MSGKDQGVTIQDEMREVQAVVPQQMRGSYKKAVGDGGNSGTVEMRRLSRRNVECGSEKRRKPCKDRKDR